MMVKWLIILLVNPVLLFVAGCTQEDRTVSSEDPVNWSQTEIADWFDQKEWLGRSGLDSDPSIDKEEFAIQYHRHKERWDLAFSFMQEADLSAIEVGNHELDGRDVFILVSEYDTKEPEEVLYEVHKEYADIHYVVSGTEYIGHSYLSVALPVTSYDEERDIRFYTVDEYQHLLADPDRFFIFFPGELHSPGIRVEENAPVKKIVIKVKI